MSPNFKNDLLLGKKYEKIFIDLFKFEKYEIKQGLFREYDIKVINSSGKEYYYEVKSDRYTHKTNNICIEFQFKNKPSGIMTTLAKKIIYFIIKPNNDYDLLLIPTKKIKREIEKKTYKQIRDLGDNKNSKCYLFDRSIFNKYLFIQD